MTARTSPLGSSPFTDNTPTTFSERIQHVQSALNQAAARANRDPAGITLIAVSKTVDRATIDQAAALGLRDFGENRVQEALSKFGPEPSTSINLHMIGHLQSNKARPAAALFSMIHSVDRLSLLTALEREAERLNRSLPVLVQVNVADEPQKSGCAVSDTETLVRSITSSNHLTIQGLMTIAPLAATAEETRPVFRQLRELRDMLSTKIDGQPLPVLSMGMTNDFEVAIEEGATHVRIGRAIFGDR